MTSELVNNYQDQYNLKNPASSPRALQWLSRIFSALIFCTCYGETQLRRHMSILEDKKHIRFTYYLLLFGGGGGDNSI